jgi:DNA-binding response OmpR family regulator
MDGPTAVTKIRAAGYRGLIIGVTGNTLDVDIQDFLRCGASDVWIKPMKLDLLSDSVCSIAKKRAESPQARAGESN